MAIKVTLNPNTLLNRKELDAASDALMHGIQLRVVSRDGVEDIPLTEDYNPARWDIELENGYVSGVRIPRMP